MKEQFIKNNPEQIWQSIESAWTNMVIINKKPLPETVKALITFCPLYGQGPLQESQLLPYPATIQESRVVDKWKACQVILKKMQQTFDQSGYKFEVTGVLANKGVLLGHQPTDNDLEALAYHDLLYKLSFQEFCQDQKIHGQYTNYKNLNVNFPVFVNPNDSIPFKLFNDSNSIDYLNDYLTYIIKQPIINNKDNRKVLKYLEESFGIKSAFWLVAGYLPFDQMIPEIVGENGIYIATERFGGLFRISKLTIGLKQLTRIELPV